MSLIEKALNKKKPAAKADKKRESVTLHEPPAELLDEIASKPSAESASRPVTPGSVIKEPAKPAPPAPDAPIPSLEDLEARDPLVEDDELMVTLSDIGAPPKPEQPAPQTSAKTPAEQAADQPKSRATIDNLFSSDDRSGVKAKDKGKGNPVNVVDAADIVKNDQPDFDEDFMQDFVIPENISSSLEEQSSRRVHLAMDRLKQQGLLTADMARSTLAEEFRVIKRPLLANAFGQNASQVKNGNLVMVSSALPGEGKTFTAINLAMSIAMEMDRTVLLVDADISRPALTRHFGFEAEMGLIDVLVEESVDLSEVLIRTDVPKLTVLPAGARHHHATELLASEYMESLAQEFSTRYPDRMVIFDTPPLMATSQASVLANIMGQVVVVVEAGRAPQHIVKEALSRLGNPEIVGLILNKTGKELGSDYYYYGYGYYGYGSYGY